MSGFTNLQFANTAAQAVDQGRHGIRALIKSHHTALNLTTRWHWQLWPDYEARIEALKPELEPLLRNGSLLGFFLGDELLFNGLSFVDLQAYSRAMRVAFPTAILYVNEAWPSLVPTMPGAGQFVGTLGAIPDAQLLRHVPPELDWWSVDIYPDWFSPSALPMFYHSFLRPKMSANQSFVLVPPFYGEGSTTKSGSVADCDDADCDRAMARWADFCITWIQGGDDDAVRIVGVMPYHWASLGNGTRARGGKELPTARERWEEFGRAVVHKEG